MKVSGLCTCFNASVWGKFTPQDLEFFSLQRCWVFEIDVSFFFFFPIYRKRDKWNFKVISLRSKATQPGRLLKDILKQRDVFVPSARVNRSFISLCLPLRSRCLQEYKEGLALFFPSPTRVGIHECSHLYLCTHNQPSYSKIGKSKPTQSVSGHDRPK